jgi:hypothetical protein
MTVVVGLVQGDSMAPTVWWGKGGVVTLYVA